ncbi:MAG TPA: alkaline phosphatase family protein [Vicinamibacterales bacterium]|nr:alkaline phosphatase family protein [Vicinamibacterales bacterium]
MNRLAFAVALSLTATIVSAQPREGARKPPKLILQITIDQLRGDLPFRYIDRLSARGFRLFMDRGIWYADAQHEHAEYETAVGHATLATGAWPSRHGMITNSAFEDYGGVAGIPVTTFSDELNITTHGRAKIFGVSMKDRGAAPLAGHTGKAFWYSSSDGCFRTSTYYYPTAPPQWVTDWCGRRPADQYANTSWELLFDRSTYLFRDVTNVYPAGSVAEANMKELDTTYRFNRTFPHPLGSGRGLYQALMLAPQGDVLTADFAKELLRQENLGDDDITDYLAISFSLTDYIAHWFSPTSLESEDNLLRLDRTLESLFAFIDAEVGLSNTLLVLAADHGGPEYPEYLATISVPTGRVAAKAVSDAATAAVSARYGTTDAIIKSYSPPYFYLDPAMLQKHKLSAAEVEAVVAEAAMSVQGIAVAVPTTQLLNGGGAADAAFLAHLRRNYFRGRSGNVYVVPKPQWQQDAEGNPPKLLSHAYTWAYDAYVPVAFAGAGLPSAMVYRRISTTDVAATLSAYMKTKFPSGNVGVPLVEVVDRTNRTERLDASRDVQ